MNDKKFENMKFSIQKFFAKISISVNIDIIIFCITVFLFSIENYQLIIMQMSMCTRTSSKHKYLGL